MAKPVVLILSGVLFLAGCGHFKQMFHGKGHKARVQTQRADIASARIR